MRHYAYLVCGTQLHVYQTTLRRVQASPIPRRGSAQQPQVAFTNYRLQLLDVLDLCVPQDLLRFIK
jgi:hypothetical protein